MARLAQGELGMTCTISEVTGSLCTAAVRPTPEDPLPVVYTALGEICAMYLISCDLATPGSPAWLASTHRDVHYLLKHVGYCPNKPTYYLLVSQSAGSALPEHSVSAKKSRCNLRCILT